MATELKRDFVDRTVTTLAQAWITVLCVTVTLSVIRGLQLAYLWPDGFEVTPADILAVFFQGARFDLKVSAAAAVLLLPMFFILPVRLHSWIAGTVIVTFGFLSLINLHYFSFYKVPFDPIVFGFFEDDTKAILQTIWNNFPVFETLLLLLALSTAAIIARKWLNGFLVARLAYRRLPTWITLALAVLSTLLLVLSIKGTLRAMALGRQNISVTTSQFLNDMVPNGVTALKFAWDDRDDAQDISAPLLGLQRLGFNSPLRAAQTLGLHPADEDTLREMLTVNGPPPDPASRKNLFFFLMESWSAEPFLYQASDFDVLGRLAPTLSHACHFSNFDSAQPGTFPTLEALLFSTPITPLTLGPRGKTPIPWATALTFKRAGYRTIFATSARSGWRELDRMLKVQGFDEVIDANDLKAAYPDAEPGIWGVWDGYLFKYLSEHLDQPQDKPLFVFALTSTNHPPYDLPADYRPPALNMDKWGGERVFDSLKDNLDTYRYATDLLGGFVQDLFAGPLGANTVIAATGDHNGRSFGRYVSPEREYLSNQVPFIIWGNDIDCGRQLELPASHRDMFPTLYPIVGIKGGYVNTGRNLLADPDKQKNSPLDLPLILSYYGPARDARGAWTLDDTSSFMCTPVDNKADDSCHFDAKEDAIDRARLGLLDWFVRSGLKKP